MQKYEILTVIGEGAYGVVLKCRDTQTGNIFAIKKFKESDEDQIIKKTTTREVKILRSLTHDNIVELKEAFRRKGVVCLVFEYVEHNLLEIMERSGNQGLRPDYIQRVMYQLIRGLAYMHSLNVVHRDIKPENLLLNDKYLLKICDFGFARQLHKDASVPGSNISPQELTDYVATRWYRPPELLVSTNYGLEIDIWGAGCIFGELIDGNPMFPGENELEQLFLIQKCIGPLIPEHYDRFTKNDRFLGMKFPQITHRDTIEQRYAGKLGHNSAKAISLLKMMLQMDPANRITASDALNHPYFDGLRQDGLLVKMPREAEGLDIPRVTSADCSKPSTQAAPLWRKDSGSDSSTHLKTSAFQIRRKEGTERLMRMTYLNKANLLKRSMESRSLGKQGTTSNFKRIKQKTMSLEKHRNKQALEQTGSPGAALFLQPTAKDSSGKQSQAVNVAASGGISSNKNPSGGTISSSNKYSINRIYNVKHGNYLSPNNEEQNAGTGMNSTSSSNNGNFQKKNSGPLSNVQRKVLAAPASNIKVSNVH